MWKRKLEKANMAKYRALKDSPPSIKVGDIVTFNDPLIPEFASKFEPVSDDEGGDDDDKQIIGNPSRDWLKARAAELEIVFASNTPTAKLQELVTEAQAAKDAKEAAEAAGNQE